MNNKYLRSCIHLQRLIISLSILFVLSLSVNKLKAQPIPVGDLWEDQFRTLQLLSDSTRSTSFSNRPVWKHTYREVFEEARIDSNSIWAQPIKSNNFTLFKSFSAGTYNPIFTNTYNSNLPYSENNGAAWYGRGFNTEMQAGGWLTSKYFTITFRPHLSFQQNSDFTTPRFIPTDGEGNPLYRSIVAGIDMPFRFGPDAFTTFDLGYSSARIHYKQLETGFSTEPLWWGPGVQYALMMSNNAPGLHHVFLGTRSPISLPLNIGDIEFKLIGAWPKDSDYFNLGEQYQQDRFMNGVNLIYSPSFLPNLSLGISRVFHRYIPEDGLRANNFFVVIQPFQKANLSESDRTGRNDGQNQLVSAYFRWVFPESGAEVYGEYFRDDHNFDLRDFLMEPDHDRAYTLGAQKIIQSNWIDFFKVNVELNSLVPGRVDEVRPQTFYYRHTQIRQGHTNGGQVLGAAIGPGSGSQYLGVKGYFDKGMLGLFIQRVEENDFFHFEFYDRTNLGRGFKDIWRHRINLNIGLKSHYKRGPMLLAGKVIWNKNYNYGRFDLGNLDVDFDTVDKHDVVNIQLQISARYLF